MQAPTPAVHEEPSPIMTKVSSTWPLQLLSIASHFSAVGVCPTQVKPLDPEHCRTPGQVPNAFVIEHVVPPPTPSSMMKLQSSSTPLHVRSEEHTSELQ